MWTSEEGNGRYRVLRRLGVGGMAEVVLAQDTVLERYVALKSVHTASDELARERLKREATVGASITHPNLVAVYDVWEKEGGEVFIVMEYVAGDTFQELIQRRGGISYDKALPVLAGVAAGLDAVHARGIVHRDVKPANILLGIDGSVKLTDLGIAAVEDRTRITSADQVMGTFSYMAPEQLDGAPAHPAIDIYALAAVAFEALSGKRAHPERNPVALANAIATRPAPDLRAVRPQTPAAVAEVLKMGMSRDPARRPRTAGELIGRLREALESPSTEEVAILAPFSSSPSPLPARPRTATGGVTAAPDPRRPTATAGRAAAAGGIPPRLAASGSPPARVKDGGPKHGGPRRGRLIAALALVAFLAAAGSIFAAFVSGGKSRRSVTTAARTHAAHRPSKAASHHLARHSPARLAERTSTKPSPSPAPEPASQAPKPSPVEGTSASASPASSSTASPAAVVQAFYEAAARHDYASAWNLADENMRNQLDGFNSFVSEMSAVRSITFHQAQTVAESSSSATVSLDTTAVLLDRTQHCTGTVQTLRTGPSQWMLDHISISCSVV